MGLQRGSYFLLLLLAPVLAAAASRPLVNDTQCGCFVTNGSNPAYYSTHRFYDFRSLSQYAADAPALINDPSAAASAPPTSGFFSTRPFADDWAIMSWNNNDSVSSGNAPTLMVNSPANLYIERNKDDGASASDTYLTMRTARLDSFQSASELESMSSNYQFVSVRMLARTVGAPGACTAIFTYRGSRRLSRVQEADIEILTSGPSNVVQYTNQPSFTSDGNTVDGASVNSTVPVPWTNWAVHRLDWTPKKSTWFVNGVEVASLSFQVPRDPSHINLNSWSDGGVWTGSMDVGKQASMQVKWIEVVFNSTTGYLASKSKRALLGGTIGSVNNVLGLGGNGNSNNVANKAVQLVSTDGKMCQSVCSIDEASEGGYAVVMSSSGGKTYSRRTVAGENGISGGSTVWVPMLITFLAVASWLPFALV